MSSLEDKFLDEFKSIDLSLFSVSNGFTILLSFCIFLLISIGALLGLTVMAALILSICFSSEAIFIIFLGSFLFIREAPYSF